MSKKVYEFCCHQELFLPNALKGLTTVATSRAEAAQELFKHLTPAHIEHMIDFNGYEVEGKLMPHLPPPPGHTVIWIEEWDESYSVFKRRRFYLAVPEDTRLRDTHYKVSPCRGQYSYPLGSLIWSYKEESWRPMDPEKVYQPGGDRWWEPYNAR